MNRNGKPLRIAANLIVTILILWFAANNIELSGISIGLYQSSWILIAFGFIVFSTNYWFRTQRIRILTQLQTDTRTLYGITSLYGMFNYLLPAKSGELTFIYLFRHYCGMRVMHSSASLLVARLLDFTILAVMIPVIILSYRHTLPNWIMLSGAAFSCLVLIGAGIIYTVIACRGSANDHASSHVKNGLSGKFRKYISEFRQALHAIHTARKYRPLVVYTILIWASIYVNFYIIVKALGYDIAFLQVMTASLILVPLTLLPVQGIANIGTHELGWVAALSVFGYPVDTAMTIALSSHVILLLYVIVLGTAGWLMLHPAPPGKSST